MDADSTGLKPRQVTNADTLQWGRIQMDADRIRLQSYSMLSWLLQWGRIQMDADSQRGGNVLVCFGGLQWGRIQMDADRRMVSAGGRANRQRASMGPHPNGCG